MIWSRYSHHTLEARSLPWIIVQKHCGSLFIAGENDALNVFFVKCIHVLLVCASQIYDLDVSIDRVRLYLLIVKNERKGYSVVVYMLLT